jgi:hypothetical protein
MGRKTPRRIHALLRATASEPGFILYSGANRMGQKIPLRLRGVFKWSEKWKD